MIDIKKSILNYITVCWTLEKLIILMKSFWNKDEISFFNPLSVFHLVYFSTYLSIYLYIYIYIYILLHDLVLIPERVATDFLFEIN